MKPDFMARMMASKGADKARRAAEIAAHRPRLQSNGLPLVFVEGDIATGFPGWIYSAAENGPPMRIGRVVAARIGRSLRVDDLYVFYDLDQALYVPAVLEYLDIEAGLFGLDRVETKP